MENSKGRKLINICERENLQLLNDDNNAVCLDDNKFRMKENLPVNKIELQRLPNYVERKVDLFVNILTRVKLIFHFWYLNFARVVVL